MASGDLLLSLLCHGQAMQLATDLPAWTTPPHHLPSHQRGKVNVNHFTLPERGSPSWIQTGEAAAAAFRASAVSAVPPPAQYLPLCP